VGWLLGQFGRERLRQSNFVVPARHFFPDHYDNSETAARVLFHQTCRFMGVDPAGVELVFYQPTHRPGFARRMFRSPLPWAGQFEVREGSNIVHVDVTLLPLPESLLAVFAHELAHQLLMGSKRICQFYPDHEFVTDLTTVFFGMGIFNANGSLENQYRLDRRGDERGRLGYLTPKNWGYVLALCAWLREEKKPTWSNWLRPGIRRIFRQSLAYLVKTGDAQVVDGGQLSVDRRVSLLEIEYPGLAIANIISSSQTDDPDDESSENHEIQYDLGEGIEAGHCGPDSAERLVTASCYVEDQEWDKAYECLSELIRIEPENGTAYQQRVWVSLEIGRVAEALEDAQAAVLLEPDDSESYRARGSAYLKVRQFGQAVDDLTRYIKEEDSSAIGHRASRGYYLRGLAYAGLGNFSQAIRDYGRAIHHWADWPEPYEARAEAYEQLGKSKLAHADHDQARRRATP
jgi:tetratricopeptide (TPR) repeat protein